MDFTGESVKMTFSYGEVTQDVILDITPKEFGSSSFDADASVVAQSRSEAALKAFHDATDSLLTSSSETPLWEGAFIEALDQSLFDSKAAFIKRGFGRYVKIAATSEVYRNDGVDYYVANGKQVLAANNGTVVFAGYLEYSGYTVIIDHGLGLKTWSLQHGRDERAGRSERYQRRIDRRLRKHRFHVELWSPRDDDCV